jgi:hypothetical protein
MSKKKGIVIHLEKKGLKGIKLGCAVNQHADTMRDVTKYNRKPKHRRDFRNERDAPVFLFTWEG